MTDNKWQSIDSAPLVRDLLLVQDGFVTIGHWSTEQYARHPKPYWKTERGEVFGVAWQRMNPPTHWMELPAPPALESQRDATGER